MAALIVCPRCTVHVREEDEARCPHCDAALTTPGGLRAASRVALLMGLGVGLAGCPVESKYGVPATASPAETPHTEPPEPAESPEPAEAPEPPADPKPASDTPDSGPSPIR